MKINPFPGVVTKKSRVFVLTQDQEDWLRTYYPLICNNLLMELTGLSSHTLLRFSRKFGLKKSLDGMHAINEQRSKTLKETNRKERLRLMYGMKRKHKYYIALKPYRRSQLQHRHGALQRGYLLAEDCSEQGGERWNICYDSDTQRSERFERNLIKDGFHVLCDA